MMNDKEEIEEELKIYKNRLEEAMEKGKLAWWEMELPSGKVKFNERKARMLGYSPDRFEHYEDFTELLHPEDYEKAMQAMRDHIEGRADRYEVEYRIKKKSGDYKWFRDVGGITEKIWDSKKVTGVVIDIDDRKKVEERKELLQTLLGHDMKNKFQIIQGYLELIDEEFDLPEEADKYFNKIKKSSNVVIDLIHKVRTLQKAEEEDIGEIEIKSVLQDAVERCEPIAEEKGIDILTEFSTQERVYAGPVLEEVFTNLIENSIYHSEGKTIKVMVENLEDEVLSRIEDDGKGVPEEKKEKIFDKGYTTDEEKGTGLGMFLVKTLIERYDGKVEVKDSELGGARFDIYLKRCDYG